MFYDDILERTDWPCGLYLFCDMERATPAQCETAARLHAKLQDFPERAKTLNHPIDHLKRYELMRALHENGVNDFNVHRATEIGEGVRYPAFLRYTDQHDGPSSDLLHTRSELEDKLAEMIHEGHDVKRLIVVEFVDVSDANGVFLKFGALRVGSFVVPGHMFAGTNWMLKHKNNKQSLIGRMERDFMRDFPYSDQVMQAFETSKLEYGRIDYGVKGGRIQVWEINDNPTLGAKFLRLRRLRRIRARMIGRPKRREAFRQAMSSLDLDASPMEFRVKVADQDCEAAATN